MFNTNRKTADNNLNAETSLIARGTAIRGDVEFAGALHVDGSIDGVVLADATGGAVFTLSEQGRVCGEIRVPNAVINGTVKGDIHAAERLELAAQARIEGDVHYNVLEMAAGAQVNGRMVHETDTPRQLPRPQEQDMDVDEDAVAFAGEA